MLHKRRCALRLRLTTTHRHFLGRADDNLMDGDMSAELCPEARPPAPCGASIRASSSLPDLDQVRQKTGM